MWIRKDFDIDDPHSARLKLFEARDQIIKMANEKDPVLVSFRGRNDRS